MPQQIPQHDSNLYIDDETTAKDVIEYVADRIAEPAVVGDTVVWNFHHKDIDAAALINADLGDGHYVVPYPVAGVWGFMVEILPVPVSDATLLTYQRDSETYGVYDNFRDSGPLLDETAIRVSLRDEMNDSLDRHTEGEADV